MEDKQVIEECILQTDVDFQKWQQHLSETATNKAVLDDLQLAANYRITGVPALVINGKHLVSGAQSLEYIIKAIEETPSKEDNNTIDTPGAACHFKNGKIECD